MERRRSKQQWAAAEGLRLLFSGGNELFNQSARENSREDFTCQLWEWSAKTFLLPCFVRVIAMKTISRRQFGKRRGCCGRSRLMPEFRCLDSHLVSRDRCGLAYPKGFLWGCATASYQVEGGAKMMAADRRTVGYVLAHSGKNVFTAIRET